VSISYRKIPFIAKDLSDALRKFLYCCAFWTVAADEELKSGEQQWLIEQFGQEGATESLSHFVNLESELFFEAFDAAAAELTDDERRKVYPFLEDWLLQCTEADGYQDVSELQIVNKIKGRLNLDFELKRLFESASGDTAGSGAEAVIMRGHTSGVLSVSIVGNRIVSGSEDGEVRIWDAESYECIKAERKHEGGVLTLAPCAERNLVFSGGRYGEVSLWSAEDGKELWRHQHRRIGGIMDASIDAANGVVYLVTNVGVAVSQDLVTGKTISEFDDRKRGAIRAVRVLPGGRLAVAGDYETIRIWGMPEGNLVNQLRGHEEGVLCMDVSPDGKTLASGSRDSKVLLWDIESGECKARLAGHEFSIYGVDFDAEGKRLLSVSWDHTMRVWDTDTQRELAKILSTDGMFNDGAFDKTGRQVVGGTSEKVLYVVPLS